MTANTAYARQDDLVGSGIARSTVFPNTMRDLRCMAGYPSLQGFASKLPQITYTRLGKIERGEVFPRHDELVSIADELGVPASKLFIDTTNPKFDREAWARAHVEGKMGARSGSFEDMKLGATLRVKRRERNLATTEMKGFNLPAATVSRIENAERTFSRWDTTVRLGIRRAIGAVNFSDMWKTVEEMHQNGELDKTMFEMFSPVALNERHNKAMLDLLDSVNDSRTLYLKRKIEQLMMNDNAQQDAPVVLPQIPLYKAVTTKGKTVPVASNEKIGCKDASDLAVALMLDSEVLGPGSPVGTILVFEPVDHVAVKAGMVIAVGSLDGLRLCHVVRAEPKPLVTQVLPLWSGTFGPDDEIYLLVHSIDKENSGVELLEAPKERKKLQLAI